MGKRSDVAILTGKNLTDEFEKLIKEGVIDPVESGKLRGRDEHLYRWENVEWSGFYEDVSAVKALLRGVKESENEDDRFIFLRVGNGEDDVEYFWNLEDNEETGDLISEFYPHPEIVCPEYEKEGEEKKPKSTLTKDRLIGILVDYIDCDLGAADVDFVRETLTDTCGCTEKELKEIGIYDWLGFSDDDEEE